jgi:hypothetical protein
VIATAIISFALDLGILLILLGCGIGMYAIIRALPQFRHRQDHPPAEPVPPVPPVEVEELSLQEARPKPGVSRTSVIRLTSESAPVKSSDMTQQQKIAAALLKAGITNSMEWPSAESDESPVDKLSSEPQIGKSE